MRERLGRCCGCWMLDSSMMLLSNNLLSESVSSIPGDAQSPRVQFQFDFAETFARHTQAEFAQAQRIIRHGDAYIPAARAAGLVDDAACRGAGSDRVMLQTEDVHAAGF